MESPPPKVAAGDEIVKKITEFLGPELEEVDRLLRESLRAESDLIDEVGDYLNLTRGKKLRPMLTLLMCRAMNPGARPPVEVAASIELIHVATLIHDDVIDKATLRRGQPSVNARWGDDVAILMADFLYARAFDLALASLEPQVMRLLCKVTQKMCEGEMLQIKLRAEDYAPEQYFDIVERKTGSLFSACTALGCLLGGGAPVDVGGARAFGNQFGIAFQVTDDILDFLAPEGKWGKELGMDAADGKQTLPILLAMAEASPADRLRMRRWSRNGRDVAEIVRLLRRYRGLDRALDEARRFAGRAAEALAGVACADEASAERLAMLPRYVIERTY